MIWNHQSKMDKILINNNYHQQFMLVVMAIVALLAVGARLISFFLRANRDARTHAREISELSEEYGRSTEDIEADMERMGTTCRTTWKAVEDAAQNGATDFGRCADEVRGQIADLVAEYGSYEEAVASWEVSQLEALGEVGSEWGMTGQEVNFENIKTSFCSTNQSLDLRHTTECNVEIDGSC